MVGFRDFPKSASLSLHISQPAKNISKNWIAAGRGNIENISFLYPCTICHAAGGSNCKTVIVNVDMDFAAQDQIVTMLCEVNSYAKKVLVLSETRAFFFL